jgi:pSer/pThr/pTyr-binding forkhead associated (FHA) protein
MSRDDLVQVQETGTLPRITDRERQRAVAATPAPDHGRYLAVESGTDEVLIPLDRPVTRLGRGIASDVTLDDASVSRRHALVVVRGERCVLLDDRSRNGTWLNGDRVSEAPLRDGDVFTLGTVRVRFLDVPS